MTRQFSLRGISAELARRLRALAAARGESVNATILHLLQQSAGTDGRRERLQRYATWSAEDLRDFDEGLRAQRTVDAELWK